MAAFTLNPWSNVLLCKSAPHTVKTETHKTVAHVRAYALNEPKHMLLDNDPLFLMR